MYVTANCVSVCSVKFSKRLDRFFIKNSGKLAISSKQVYRLIELFLRLRKLPHGNKMKNKEGETSTHLLKRREDKGEAIKT